MRQRRAALSECGSIPAHKSAELWDAHGGVKLQFTGARRTVYSYTMPTRLWVLVIARQIRVADDEHKTLVCWPLCHLCVDTEELKMQAAMWTKQLPGATWRDGGGGQTRPTS